MISTMSRRRNPRPNNKRWTPFKENQGWRCDAEGYLTASTPETNQIFPLDQGPVEESVGDFTGSPFLDLGLGPPSPVAKSEPELAVAGTE